MQLRSVAIALVIAAAVVGSLGCGGHAQSRQARPLSTAPTPTTVTDGGSTSSTSAASRPESCDQFGGTCFFLGKKKLGVVNEVFDCPNYSGGYVTGGRHSLAVHEMDNLTDGYAVLRPSGRWDIYGVGPMVTERGHVGYAIRRSRERWDVLRFGPNGPYLVGYTIGPDGPAAATLLLTTCWEG